MRSLRVHQTATAPHAVLCSSPQSPATHTASPTLALQPDSGVVTCSTHQPGLVRSFRALRRTGSSQQTDEEHTPPAGEIHTLTVTLQPGAAWSVSRCCVNDPSPTKSCTLVSGLDGSASRCVSFALLHGSRQVTCVSCMACSLVVDRSALCKREPQASVKCSCSTPVVLPAAEELGDDVARTGSGRGQSWSGVPQLWGRIRGSRQCRHLSCQQGRRLFQVGQSDGLYKLVEPGVNPVSRPGDSGVMGPS